MTLTRMVLELPHKGCHGKERVESERRTFDVRAISGIGSQPDRRPDRGFLCTPSRDAQSEMCSATLVSHFLRACGEKNTFPEKMFGFASTGHYEIL